MFGNVLGMYHKRSFSFRKWQSYKKQLPQNEHLIVLLATVDVIIQFLIIGQYFFNLLQIILCPNSGDDPYENIRQMTSVAQIGA